MTVSDNPALHDGNTAQHQSRLRIPGTKRFEALQFFEQHGEVCPANWSRGKKGMKPTNQGVADYLAST